MSPRQIASRTREPCSQFDVPVRAKDGESMKVGIVAALVAMGATLFVSSAASAAGCLDYEPATVTVERSVSLKPAYGPPGFGEDPQHDAREDYLALTLDTPACTTASPEPGTDDVAET